MVEMISKQSMKIEFDIFNKELFRTLTFSLKFQKKAQVSIIYMKNIVISFLINFIRSVELNGNREHEKFHDTF
jgi:hypothetical protein